MQGLNPPRQRDGKSPGPGLVDVHDRPISVGSPSWNE